MAKLKLQAIHDIKPAKMTIEIPAPTYANLIEYAEIMERETGQNISDPKILVVPMLEKFMATDRAFLKAKRIKPTQ